MMYWISTEYLLYSLKLCLILKPKRKSFDIFDEIDDHFHDVQHNIKRRDVPKQSENLFEEVKFSFGYIEVMSGKPSTVLVSEKLNEKDRTYLRKFRDFFVTLQRPEYVLIFEPPTTKPFVQENICNTLDLMGVFITREPIAKTILFFRLNSTIQYCYEFEVNT